MTVVDIHPHIVSKDTDKYPITPIGGKRSDWSNDHSVDLETMIEQMDAAGVDKAAVVHSSTTYGFNCEYVADAVAKYPDRLAGVFSIDVMAPDNVEKMKKWYDLGCTGIRIFTRGSTLKGAIIMVDDAAIEPVYRYAAELNMPVVSNVTIDKFDHLENVLRKFPETTFVVDHCGSPDFSEGAPYPSARALFDLARFPNLYIKISSRNFQKSVQGDSKPEDLFPRLVDAYGANRLAWASNYPANSGSLKSLVDMADECLASVGQEDRAWIMGKTALKLYPVLAGKESVSS